MGATFCPVSLRFLVNYHGPLGPAPPSTCYYPLSIIHYAIIHTLHLATITEFALGSMFIITSRCWFGKCCEWKACVVFPSTEIERHLWRHSGGLSTSNCSCRSNSEYFQNCFPIIFVPYISSFKYTDNLPILDWWFEIETIVSQT